MNGGASEHTAAFLVAAKRKRTKRALTALAGLVVLSLTTWALMLPGITMANVAYCGIQEHGHSDACYERVLVCGFEEGESESADSGSSSASSGNASGSSSYSNSASDTGSPSVSTGTSFAGSISDEGGVVATSGDDSGVDGGAATSADSSLSSGSADPAASSGLADSAAVEEGSGAAVLSASDANAAAGEGSSSSGSSSGGSASAEHVHTDACYERVLVCNLSEHEHSLACFADKSADVETEDAWEATLPADDEFTGEWAHDVLVVAESQLGYAESSANYEVGTNASGVEIAKGYTRYGAWYGDAYGDWCAMFASFCLYYAGVDVGLGVDAGGMPVDANCQNWIKALSAEDVALWRPVEDGVPVVPAEVVAARAVEAEADADAGVADESSEAVVYEPKPGDLIFFDWNGDGTADHVGFVYELIDAIEDDLAKIKTIEGNASDGSADVVRYKEYVVDDASIMGYAELPENPGNQVAMLTENFAFTTPTVVESASTSEFIDLNLYDYNGYINDKYNADESHRYPGFQWNGGAYMDKNTFNRHVVDYIDFGNSNITDRSYDKSGTTIANGKSANAVIVGVLYTNNAAKNTGAINRLWWDGSANSSITNRPVGMSTGIEALSRTLGSDGYPALAVGGSLRYLFTDDNYSVFKKNTQSIDGLFQKDEKTGAYYYNSRWNHAQYSDNAFTLYNQIITPNFIVYPFGNFLPFNTITDGTKATQVGSINDVNTYIDKLIADMADAVNSGKSPTKTQLTAMLKKYRASNISSGITTSKQAINDYLTGGPTSDTSLITDDLLNKMYNIDWDEETNFFFGMDMTMNFFQPKDGMTGNDNGSNENEINSETNLRAGEPDGIPDYPMEFYFTGDDDVWVYIDGVLFLDLTGIHRHVGGKIDFVNGIVEYYKLDTAGTGDVSDEAYETYTFAQLLTAAGKSTDGLNEKGTFKDYSTHQFKFYYMERGSGSSVCRMNFNFPLLRQNSISVSKEVDAGTTNALGNPDYQFQILKADSEGEKTNDLFIGADVEYTVYDANDNKIETRKTDANGVFTLKAGQRAEFTGIDENAGKYYVRELVDSSSTGLGQYGKVTVSGEVATKSGDVTVGDETFVGMDSPVKDMSDGATKFRFVNAVKVDKPDDPDNPGSKLGSLSITKELTEYSKARVSSTFDMEVTLDGESLPVGTSYAVTKDGSTSETRTVEKKGIIALAPGETATISNILLGTKFAVKETSDSAEGYIVDYSGGGSSVEVVNGKATGTIASNATVHLTVTNSEKGATVEIPGVKSLAASDGFAHSYKFRLDEVTDETGAIPKENGLSLVETSSIAKDSGSADFKFTINYVLTDLNASGELPVMRYYRITENPNSDARANDTVFIVEVTISEDASSKFGATAEVTRVWEGVMKDGVPSSLTARQFDDGGFKVDFVNVLVGSLEVSKSVVGTATDQDFTFKIALDKGSSALASLPDLFNAKIYHKDDSSAEEVVLQLVDGELMRVDDASASDNNADEGGSDIGDANIIGGSGASAGGVDSDGDGSLSDVSPITLKDGERIVIEGIPYGTAWTVAETNANGFEVSHEVTVAGDNAAPSDADAGSDASDDDQAGVSAADDANASDTDSSGDSSGTTSEDANKTASGTIVVGSTKVAFTNTQLYQLPEAGGVGTAVCVLAGLALIGVALVGMRLLRRRKEVG